MTRLVFTCGDINGIGPEICVKTFNKIFNPRKRQIIFLCPKNVFLRTIQEKSIKFTYQIVSQNSLEIIDHKKVTVIDIGNYKQSHGKPTKESGLASYNAIIDAVKLTKSGFADAIITAPISKTAFKLAGKNFSGHTELLARLSKSKKFMMIFLSKKMICGLATIHVQLKKVSSLLSKKKLIESANILLDTLQNDLGIKTPKIAMLGLNPHAGENGNIGSEENKILIPVVKSFRRSKIEGPFVPDAFYGNHCYKNYDAILGMYHDQVLIPFKMLNFSKGVNFTAGLSLIRTSPDHGTAFDIAGKGTAQPDSMIESVHWAEKIFKNRKNLR
ncbi:MAG: 4-hydroxythreonine-4-phosphate dehydrogenase PdxA [Melioribacteraceae bacterium]|nr:4-hydroxythreonine-4-phosphate dehydrogenase PdxA [Melioribacteraceae bacterium]